MNDVVNLAKLWIARAYPAVVWGTLMGLVAHAGLNMEWVRAAVEADTPPAVIQESSPKMVQADLQGVTVDASRLP
jgi:hypothetical protein